VGGIDPSLDALGERLAELSALADDVGGELRAYRDHIDHDPVGLDAMLARLSDLHGLMRKYGPRLEDVLARRAEAATLLGEVGVGEDGMRAAEATVAEARIALEAAGDELDRVRREAAPAFTAALADAVADLAMPGASFEVAFGELEFDAWTADGPSRIEFLYSPATGTVARPLSKIASGGELSRVMLALKGVLGEADTVRTLVFDEIDAGIGGSTAHAVGRRLARLAETHQVIVVTHLAQVAAYADSQLVVRRSADAGSGTTVSYVEGDARISEIARMLAGNDSQASIAHAEELLAEALSAR
jgi:DNA repair protein RecN (Recombination protein N)